MSAHAFTTSWSLKPIPSTSTWVADVKRWIKATGATTAAETQPNSFSSSVVSVFSKAYTQIFDLIQSFSIPGTEMSVDAEAASDAKEFLARLISVNAAPPTVFPSAGDAVVFVWQKAGSKEYAYYSDDIVSITHIPSVGEDWKFDLDLRDANALSSLARFVGR